MDKENIFISVCITSYKRVRELQRCLNSIDSKHKESIEVIVSEDNSPERERIREVVEEYAKELDDMQIAELCERFEKIFVLGPVVFISTDNILIFSSIGELKYFFEQNPWFIYATGSHDFNYVGVYDADKLKEVYGIYLAFDRDAEKGYHYGMSQAQAIKACCMPLAIKKFD